MVLLVFSFIFLVVELELDEKSTFLLFIRDKMSLISDGPFISGRFLLGARDDLTGGVSAFAKLSITLIPFSGCPRAARISGRVFNSRVVLVAIGGGGG